MTKLEEFTYKALLTIKFIQIDNYKKTKSIVAFSLFKEITKI